MKKSVLTMSMVTVFLFIPMLLQAQEQSLMLGPADLVPYQDNNDYVRSAVALYSQTGSGYNIFHAPIHLPNNARLKRVVLFFRDSNASFDVQLQVFRNNKYTGGQDNVIPVTYTSGTPGVSRLTAYADWSYNQISNHGYSYALRIWFTAPGTTLMFYGAKVIYQ